MPKDQRIQQKKKANGVYGQPCYTKDIKYIIVLQIPEWPLQMQLKFLRRAQYNINQRY